MALKNAEKGPTYIPCVAKKQVGSSIIQSFRNILSTAHSTSFT